MTYGFLTKQVPIDRLFCLKSAKIIDNYRILSLFSKFMKILFSLFSINYRESEKIFFMGTLTNNFIFRIFAYRSFAAGAHPMLFLSQGQLLRRYYRGRIDV